MKPKNSSRRRFLTQATAATAVASLVPAVAKAKSSTTWKLATTWSPKMPILQESVDLFAKVVEQASDGALKIKVYAAGELIPAFGVFDAVSQGTISAGVSSPYYWSGKLPAAALFSSVPFGMTTQQLASWLQSGGGHELWQELYAPHNIVPLTIGLTGAQMGGWYKKQLNTAADLKGLKIRIPGLGGRVMAKAGANVVLMPGSEVFTALERGTLDAVEWLSPFHDRRLGLHQAAKYYYYPSWQEPSTNIELMINSSAWDNLSEQLKMIVKIAAQYTCSWFLAKSDAANGPALQELEREGVTLLNFPAEILSALKSATDSVLAEMSKDDFARKVIEHYQNFQSSTNGWYEVGERALYNLDRSR